MSDKRKKILYVITKSNWGGAQRYVYDLATIDAPPYEVVVALGGEGILKSRLTEAGIRTVTIDSLERNISVLKEFKAARALWHIIRSEAPDVIHLNSSKAGALGALLARLAGVKNIIFTAHGWAFNENRSLLARTVLSLLHWTTIMFSHTTIAVSAHVQDQMSSFPFTRKKMHVIPLGVPIEAPLARDAARKQLEALTGRSLNDTTLIGTIAELHPVKNYPMALKAFSLFHLNNPKSAYVIMGDGEERTRLEALAHELNIKNNVHFLDFVPNAATLLSGLDIFLLTSHSEAFGYVLLEAGLAHVPVVATRVGGIPEIIESTQEGLLVERNDHEGAAHALDTLASSPQTQTRLSTALYAKIIKKYTQANMIERTIALYED